MKANSLERFEIIGALYQHSTGYLRPGKDAVTHDTGSPENHARFEQWFSTESFGDAINRIHTLEEQVAKLESKIEDLEDAVRGRG